MTKTHSIERTLLMIFIDAALLYAALLAGLLLRYYPTDDFILLLPEHTVAFAGIFAIWLLIFGAFGLYDPRFLKNEKIFVYRLIRAIITSAITTILIFYTIPVFSIEPRRNLLIIAGFATIFIVLWRHVFNHMIVRTSGTRVIFLGSNSETADMINYLLENPQFGQHPVGVIQTPRHISAEISKNAPLPANIPIYPLASLTTTITGKSIDTIVMTREAKNNPDVVRALFRTVPLGITIVEFSSYVEAITGKIPPSLIAEVWFLENLIGKSNPRYEFQKRVLDVFLSVVFGAMFLLILPIAGILIVFSTSKDLKLYKEKRARPGDGILFFRQPRIGRAGEVFNFIKLRSQILGAERMDAEKANGSDPRHFPIGTFLRRMYIDELPQIWNVLKGEMSFVGPRPERPEYVAQLKNDVPFYEMRLLVKPGITGWAQINMEDDASVKDAPEKMQYDLYYVKNRSLVLDLLILLRTFFAVIQRQGR